MNTPDHGPLLDRLKKIVAQVEQADAEIPNGCTYGTIDIDDLTDAIAALELGARVNAGHIALIESQRAALSANSAPAPTAPVGDAWKSVMRELLITGQCGENQHKNLDERYEKARCVAWDMIEGSTAPVGDGALVEALERVERAWKFYVNSPGAPIAATASMDGAVANAIEVVAEYRALTVPAGSAKDQP